MATRSKPHSSDYAQPVWEEPQPARAPAPFSFRITKVVHEFVQPDAGGTDTIGEVLDFHLREAALRGDEVQSVTLAIEEGQWFNMAAALRRDTQA